MTLSLIVLTDVSLRLYTRILFPHTSWTIGRDQHWAVIGPNGSGKTTLMRALLGQVPVVQGQIAYHLSPPLHRQIAYVAFEAQQAAFKLENRFYQARWNAGVVEPEIGIDEYLSPQHVLRANPFHIVEPHDDPAAFAAHKERVIEQLGIDNLRGKTVLQLSNGERRKVQIARALLRQPRVLILDNLFAGLDVGFRERLKQVIDGLMQGEMCVIVVTARHDEIPAGITHVLRVDQCRVVERGLRQQILAHVGAQHRKLGEFDAPLRKTPAPTQASAASNEALIHLEEVNVAYNGVPVLTDVSWTVRHGEHWALLGPNGAGKTTLLGLILGDNPQAYANWVWVFGQQRGQNESIWEIKQRIGWVAPELHLYYPKHFSALCVVCSGFFDSVGLYRRPTAEQRRTAEQWMDKLDITACAQSPFGALSQGQQRMVLIARALVKAPALLILDEPCQGLDPANAARVRQTVDAIGKQTDTTIIYVTHEMQEIPAVIEHTLRLDRGHVII
ncbi:MAG: ATP-binding cassette domain-containing protein [Anaerolineae bacterium]|nr:ATP-binding cassette domain-containing protein [Anaerolineae bacterium]